MDRLVWLAACAVTLACALATGVPLWLSLTAFAVAVSPVLVALAGRLSHGDRWPDEIETSLSLAFAALAVAFTGGFASPLLTLFAAVITRCALDAPRRKVVETALLATLSTGAAGVAALFIDPPGADVMRVASVYAVAALVRLAVLSTTAFASVRIAPVGEPARSAEPGAGVRPSAAEALQRAEAAERALENRTRFFAQTGHELRTPLNAILGFADMMRQGVFGPLPDRYREYAQLIHEGGEGLQRVVDDITDLARIEAGRYEIERHVVSLDDIIDECLRLMSHMAARKGIELVREAGPDAEALADARAVRQITLNLVSNAIKFTPRGGRVRVTAMEEADGAWLSVADTGPGLSAEEMARLSRPFEQGELGRREKGSGLGLSVVRAFAELHGGKLVIHSQEGQGAVFAVFFPRPADVAAPVTGAESTRL